MTEKIERREQEKRDERVEGKKEWSFNFYIVPLEVKKFVQGAIFAAAASEPEANERGSSLISRRLHYRGLQSLFLTKRKVLW